MGILLFSIFMVFPFVFCFVLRLTGIPDGVANNIMSCIGWSWLLLFLGLPFWMSIYEGIKHDCKVKAQVKAQEKQLREAKLIAEWGEIINAVKQTLPEIPEKDIEKYIVEINKKERW